MYHKTIRVIYKGYRGVSCDPQNCIKWTLIAFYLGGDLMSKIIFYDNKLFDWTAASSELQYKRSLKLIYVTLLYKNLITPIKPNKVRYVSK